MEVFFQCLANSKYSISDTYMIIMLSLLYKLEHWDPKIFCDVPKDTVLLSNRVAFVRL